MNTAPAQKKDSGPRGLLKSAGVVLALAVGTVLTVLALGAAAVALFDGKWADMLDAGKEGVGGLIGLGVLAVTWHKYGWTRVRESMSFAAYEHDQASNRYRELKQAADRLAALAERAESDADGAGPDRERKKAEAAVARAKARRAATKASQARAAFVDAIRGLHEQYPSDVEVADELGAYTRPQAPALGAQSTAPA